MPFPKQIARPFTRENIAAIAGNPMGCYGLFVNGGKWVYVGKGDIKTRLLAHFNGDNPCITGQRPSHYMDVVTDDYDQAEKALIVEYDPVCNKKVG